MPIVKFASFFFEDEDDGEKPHLESSTNRIRIQAMVSSSVRRTLEKSRRLHSGHIEPFRYVCCVVFIILYDFFFSSCFTLNGPSKFFSVFRPFRAALSWRFFVVEC